MAHRLQGKIAIVTGAGRGIGAATARAFAEAGATVVIAERDPVTGPAMAAALKALGATSLFVGKRSPGDARGIRTHRRAGEQCRNQRLP
jgi:NAD(P)-dependent dehydrogenase (short-subunit alcohol dehydrogenase family)